MRLKLLFAAICALLIGCDKRSDFVVVQGPMLGTTLHVISDRGEAGELFREIMLIDSQMKSSMSIFDENSLLNRLNRNLTDSVDSHIAYNLELAHRISEKSGGYYDVTIRPLVDAWGFSGREREESPNIDSLLEFVGYEKVRIENGRLIKEDRRVQLDFNSIAKGYTVDKVVELLERKGAENYLVDIGGEVRCKGHNREGKMWRIGVERPIDNVIYGTTAEARIGVENAALATSGNYRRYFIDKSGAKVGHTINPHTGHSDPTRLLSATVIAPTCAEADALATMYLSLGAERSLQMVRGDSTAKVLFILAKIGAEDSSEEPEFEIFVSEAMQEQIL